MDDVFRALADPTRRELLDALFIEDGQTLASLEAKFAMTRFGVMKHLRILEDACLVLSRRSGREKLHFLNPVPVRELHDRWVAKFTAPIAAELVALKHDLETSMEKVYEIYIRTTPELLWRAIVTPEIRSKFTFGAAAYSDWTVGSTVNLVAGDLPLGDGEVLECDPPRKLVHTVRSLWSDDVRAEGFSRVTWEITQVEDSCQLRVIHDQLRDGCNEQIFGGWPMILSGLKTWLETETLLTTPGSLLYSQPS